MQEFVNKKGVFTANQFEFRTRLSETQQAAHLAEAVAREDCPRKKAVVALFNLGKAYDKIWKTGLLLKHMEQRFSR